MTTTLTVVYEAPTDPGAFVQRYREEHVPLANRILGSAKLIRWDISEPIEELDNSSGDVSLLVTIWFDSDAKTVLQTLKSEDGQELLEHAQSLTQSRMYSYLCKTHEVSAK